MNPVSLSLSLILASSVFPAYAVAFSGTDGHPDGHLGRAWEIAVGVSLGLLLFGAAVTITLVTIRQRRRNLQKLPQPEYTYASRPHSASLPYGISRPSSIYQPRDKHNRKTSPDRPSRLKESV